MIPVEVIRDTITSQGPKKVGDKISISESEYNLLSAGLANPRVKKLDSAPAVEHQEAPVETQQAPPLSERDEKPAKKSPRGKKKN